MRANNFLLVSLEISLARQISSKKAKILQQSSHSKACYCFIVMEFYLHVSNSSHMHNRGFLIIGYSIFVFLLFSHTENSGNMLRMIVDLSI
jgi:hypothetical protein